MRVSTESIWALGSDLPLEPQPNRQIIIDPAHTFAHMGDIGGIVPVSNGLAKRDRVVFLRFYGAEEGQDIQDTKLEGYFVGTKQADGSGMLVHGDSLESMPEQFMSPKLLKDLHYLDRIGVDLHGDFNLTALAKFIKQRRTF